MDTITVEVLHLDPFHAAQWLARERQAAVHQLPDGRQIEIVNERTAKLLSVGGEPLSYMHREFVEYETSLMTQWLRSREVVR